MTNNTKQIFLALYQTLEEYWEKTKEPNLESYLADACPGDWEPVSADPVVFRDFQCFVQHSFGKVHSDYDLVLDYLDSLDAYYGDIKQIFESIPKDSFESHLSSVTNKK